MSNQSSLLKKAPARPTCDGSLPVRSPKAFERRADATHARRAESEDVWVGRQQRQNVFTRCAVSAASAAPGLRKALPSETAQDDLASSAMCLQNGNVSAACGGGMTLQAPSVIFPASKHYGFTS